MKSVKQKKVLFLKWMSFGNDFVKNALEKYDYEVIDLIIDPDSEDIYCSELLAKQIGEGIDRIIPEFVFSFNFYPIAATVCYEKGVRYVSWTYDSPYVHLYAQEIFLSTNRVFVFDSFEQQELKKAGANNIYYLPVGAGTSWYNRIILTKEAYDQYACDIAFIGQTYAEDVYHLYDGFGNLTEYESGYLDGLIRAQEHIYGSLILEEGLTGDILAAIKRVFPYESRKGNLMHESRILADYLLARRVTACERNDILSALSQKHHLRLYTAEHDPHIVGAEIMGWIDYYNDAPLAIRSAKINLNITLKSIRKGIPLRVMDILGCGGFLISNYQSDMMEYFEPGKDYVMYTDVNEVEELAGYYLKHDRERELIAASGCEKAGKTLSWEIQVRKLLEII